MSKPASVRDRQIIAARAGGATLREIAKQHNVSRETIRLALSGAGERIVDQLETLLAAGETIAYSIPGHAGEDFDNSIELLRWSVGQLTRRGWRVSIGYAASLDGVTITLQSAGMNGRNHE